MILNEFEDTPDGNVTSRDLLTVEFNPNGNFVAEVAQIANRARAWQAQQETPVARAADRVSITLDSVSDAWDCVEYLRSAARNYTRMADDAADMFRNTMPEVETDLRQQAANAARIADDIANSAEVFIAHAEPAQDLHSTSVDHWTTDGGTVAIYCRKKITDVAMLHTYPSDPTLTWHPCDCPETACTLKDGTNA